MQNKEATIQDVLDAVNDYATITEENFRKVDRNLKQLREELRAELRNEIGSVKDEIHIIKSTMVTKSYLDEKIGNLRSEVIQRDKATLDAIERKRIISSTEKERILKLE